MCKIFEKLHGQSTQSIKLNSPSIANNSRCTHVDFSTLDPMYKNIRIKAVLWTHNARFHALLSDSRFCQNIMDEHRSRRVYFVVDVRKKEVLQRCLCKCSNKTCSSFVSRKVKMGIKDYYKIIDYVKENARLATNGVR